MKPQIITVNTKGGLIAAFECAKDYYGETLITLKRKSGQTIYSFYPDAEYLESASKRIDKIKGKIRNIKATDLLY